MKNDKRKVFNVGPDMVGKPIAEWTDEQRRLGGAWSRHDIQHRTDELCQPYDWRPGWTTLTADDIQNQLATYYQNAR